MMKKRRVLIFTFLALLLIVGLFTSLMVRAAHREQASLDLLSAIKDNDTSNALAALKAGADPNIHVHPDEKPLSVWEHMQQIFGNLFHTKHEADTSPTVLLFALYQIKIEPARQENPVIIKALLDAGADPNTTGLSEQGSPLMWGATRRTPESLRLLLSHGANIHQKANDGFTPLHVAARLGNVETVQRLMDAGADIEAQDARGMTPLLVASSELNKETVEALIHYQARVNVRDKGNHTPLDVAIAADNQDIIDLLRKAGAKTARELDAEVKH